MHTYRSWCLGLAIGLLAAAASVHAQSFPNRTVRFVVHFPPGGPTDFVARALGQKLSEAWKQPVVIENRPGAGGVIGVDERGGSVTKERVGAVEGGKVKVIATASSK